MVFDAHDRAFAFFKRTCGRGIYDNMKTAVETVFVGKGRLYNRRFLQMCSHYLVDPVCGIRTKPPTFPGGCRPPFRNDVAHRSEMMPPTPGAAARGTSAALLDP
jgi:hypothetical protein